MKKHLILFFLLLAMCLECMAGCGKEPATPTATVTPTTAAKLSETPTPTEPTKNTPAPTATSTPTPTATSAPTPTATRTPTATAIPTATNTPTPYVESPASDFEYYMYYGGVCIKGYTGTDEVIVIPSEIEGIKVTTIANNAFYGGDYTNVIIPNGVTYIWSNAFGCCKKLESITIPNSVEEIGYEAFAGCSNLTNVIFSDNVPDIGEGTFEYTPWLERQRTISPLVIVNNTLIDGTRAKGDIIIPDDVTSIGNYAFYNSEISSIIIPNSVMSIGECAFYGCNGLTSLTFPSSVTSIGDSAFCDCKRLRDVIFSGNLISVGWGAFGGTPWLKNQRSTNPLVIVDNILIDGGTAKGEVVIPNNVTSIAEGAFSYNDEITSITMPEGVTNIGDYAFCVCSNLKDIIIPSSVSSIGKDAFSETRWFEIQQQLNPIVVANNILIDGTNAYGDIVIPDGVTTIGCWAFWQNTNVTSIVIPEGVTTIENLAFFSITSITIPASVTKIDISAIVIPEYLTSIYVKYDSYAESWVRNHAFTHLMDILIYY